MRSQSIDLDRIEDFHELKNKGGVLGRLNVRVFYLGVPVADIDPCADTITPRLVSEVGGGPR